MYLLDTNMISIFARAQGITPAEENISQRLRSLSDQIYLSVITISEIETGISRLVRNGATSRAANLKNWLEPILATYGSRIYGLDLETARMAGRLFDKAVGKGGSPGFPDAAIAATAQIHGMTVVTRNTAHFVLFDAPCFNPYDGWPGDA